MRFFWLILMSLVISGCSGGGGGGSSTSTPTYSAEYKFPDNDLKPGEGVRVVEAIEVIRCFETVSKKKVDLSLCKLPEENKPKLTQKSPSGFRDVVVEGATSAREYVEEGTKVWILKPELIVCDFSNGYTAVGVMCKIPGYESVYSEYSSPTKLLACDGTELLTREYQNCRNNITLENVDSSLCSGHSDPNPTKEHLSPAGLRVYNVPEGTQTVECVAGQERLAGTIVDVTCILPDQYKSGNSCINSTYSSVFKDPVNSKTTVCSGTETIPRVYDYCKRDHDNVVVDGSKCSNKNTMDSVTYKSPYDRRPLSIPNSDGSAYEECGEGQTSYTVVDGSISCLSGNHKDGITCAPNTISCAAHELTPMFATSGTKTWDGSSYGNCIASSCDIGRSPVAGYCAEAPIGFYSFDGVSVNRCPDNSSTASAGSKYITSCVAIAGYYNNGDLLSNGTIDEVGQGYYSTGDGLRTACSNLETNSTKVTYGPGTTNTSNSCEIVSVDECVSGHHVSANQCLQAQPGHRANGVVSLACGTGEYQNLSAQSSCKTCSKLIADHIVDLNFVASSALTSDSCPYQVSQCEAGYYPDGTSCSQAGVGYFADGFSNSQCPQNSSTSTVGSTSISDCLANAGYYKDVSDQSFKVVGVDYYSPALNNSRIKCALPQNVTTAAFSNLETKTSQSDCDSSIVAVLTCSAGYYFNSNPDKSCSIVPQNYFSDGNGIVANSCGSNRSTTGQGSISEIECLADPGYFQITQGASATECEPGTYQPLSGQASCNSCDYVTPPSKALRMDYARPAITGPVCPAVIGSCIPTYYPNPDKTACLNGLYMVIDIWLGTSSSNPIPLFEIGEKMLLAATTSSQGRELWVTDGSSAGTKMFKNINTTSSSSYPTGPFESFGNGEYMFFAIGPSGAEPYVTDGTSIGTKILKEINASGDSMPSSYYTGRFSERLDQVPQGPFLNRVLFTANDGVNGSELWITDGSKGVSGTVKVKDINPGSAGSNPNGYHSISPGLIVFQADDGIHGIELWITDGNPDNTVLLKDINPSGGSTPDQFNTLSNGKTVFTAMDGVNGYELWVTDGTAAGTYMLLDINEGPDSSNPSAVTKISENLVVFSAHNTAFGNELWSSDGTVNGTKMIANIAAGGISSGITNITSVGNGRALFFANDGIHGFEPWVTDGTSAGTTIVKDIWENSQHSISEMSPPTIYPIGNGKAIFVANTYYEDKEPWVTDGTSAGTYLLRNVAPGLGVHSSADSFTVYGGKTVLFRADDGSSKGVELYMLNIDSIDGVRDEP